MTDDQSADEKISDVIASILRQQDQSQPVDRATLLEQYPEYQAELIQYFQSEDNIADLAGPLVETYVGRQDDTTADPLEQKSQHPPQNFGRYRIVRSLGEGGMGAVYLAQDTVLNREVALKIPRIPKDKPSLVQRFFREAKTAAAIHHRNICPVFDMGTQDGQHYITMAYIRGQSLADYAKDFLPAVEAARVVRSVALALQEAHDAGVVHRDLKPANIMMDVKNEPVVMDFGLARQESSHAETQLTQAGMIVGTPAYMSPEQINDSGSAGPAADIYSLGIILYKLLTGKTPFGGSVVSVISQIVTEAPPRPSMIVEGIHPALETICLKAIAKSPDDRHSSMAEFAQQLDGFLASETNSDSSAVNSSELDSPSTVAPVVAHEPDSAASGELAETRILDGNSPSLATADLHGQEPSEKPERSASGQPPRTRVLIAAAFGGLILIFGLVFMFQTKDGYLRVEVNDPSITVTMNQSGLTFHQTDKDKTIKVEPQENESLRITSGDFVFESGDFKLLKGETVAISVTQVDGVPIATIDGQSLELAPTKSSLASTKPTDAPTGKHTDAPTNSSLNELVASLIRRGAIFAAHDKNVSVDQLPEIIPEIEHVNFTGCKNLAGDEVGDILLELPALMTASMLVDDFPVLNDRPLQGSTIEALDLQCPKGQTAEISDEQIKCIAQITNLSALRLAEVSLLDRHLPMLQPLVDLEQLDISYNHVRGEGLAALKNLPRLSELLLGNANAGRDPDYIVRLGELTSLTRLEFNAQANDDLKPLAKLEKLDLLNLAQHQIVDIAPLRKLSLDRLYFWYDPLQHKESLMEMTSLQSINGTPYAEFLELDPKHSQSPPITPETARYINELIDQGLDLYGFDERRKDVSLNESWQQNADRVRKIEFMEVRPTRQQLAALIATFPNFVDANFMRFPPAAESMAPLMRSKLQQINFVQSDVEPTAQHMEILSSIQTATALQLPNCRVTDEALQGMKNMAKLDFLNLRHNPITGKGIAALANQNNFRELWLTANAKESASNALKELGKLTRLDRVLIDVLPDADLTPMSSLQELHSLEIYSGEPIHDISPLRSLKLQQIRIDFDPDLHASTLRAMKNLKSINDTPKSELLPETP